MGLTTLRAAVEYDGTAFCGFQQQQPSVRTVGAELERALAELFGERVVITAAGRTDSGVHATGQVISFSIPRIFPIERLALALNRLLPDDVTVRDIAEAGNDFSARRSATSRSYVYMMFCRPEPAALFSRYTWHVRRPLDLTAMREAAAHLVGEHDFRSFCGTLPESGPTVRVISFLGLERRGELIRVEVTADGFLHHMVRTIVGTLVECGRGRREPGTLLAILAARDRAAAGLNAPARGLYLAGVRYPNGYDSYREPLDPGGLSR